MSKQTREQNFYEIPDGVTIVAEQVARFTQENAPNLGSVGVEIGTVREILLSNGDTAFKCAHPNGPDCAYTARIVRSVTAHQRSHGAQTLLNRTSKELKDLQAKEAQEFANRSNGAKQANAKRRELHAEAERTDLETAITRLQVTKTNLAEAQRTYDEALTVFVQVARRYERNATPAKPTPIPADVAAKAEKWDKYVEFQKLVNG